LIEVIVLLLLALIFFFTVFYYLSKPLSQDQILGLSQKRRQKRIKKYFASSYQSCRPSDAFKKSLKPDGKFYSVDLDLPDIPCFVSSLLKYKKHEWSVITFIEERRMKYLWANKGPDRTKVTLLSINSIVETAKKHNCDTIMAFHNHPAHDPNHYSYRKPSDNDLYASQEYSKILNSLNVSYLDHVCERGTAYRFSLKPSETLHPFKENLNFTEKENLQGRMAHVKLHLELAFSTQKEEPTSYSIEKPRDGDKAEKPAIVWEQITKRCSKCGANYFSQHEKCPFCGEPQPK